MKYKQNKDTYQTKVDKHKYKIQRKQY
jgi:hypothetical protein